VTARVQLPGAYGWFALVGVLFAAGLARAGTPATTAITESLPENKQGVASAVNDTAREIGSAFGIAILGSVLNQQYRDGMSDAVRGLPHAVAEGAQGSIAFTQSANLDRLGPAAQQLVATAQDSFVTGSSVALLVAAGVVAVTAVVVAWLAPSHTSQPESEDRPLEEAARTR
jgi:hypothetical protein